MPPSVFADAAAPWEKKFNPHHDPRDGRFTTAAGGSTGSSTPSGWRSGVVETPDPSEPTRRERMIGSFDAGSFNDGVYRPSLDNAPFRVIQYRPTPGIGSNSGAFYDPLTLDRMFPGIRPGASEPIAVLDSLLGLREPAASLTSALSQEFAGALIKDIKAVNPDYRYDSFGFPKTFDGQMREINELRFQRAATRYKVKGEVEPLQIETLRRLQTIADDAYDNALELNREGKLDIRLSPQEAIGNYVDQMTRLQFRALLTQFGIRSDRSQIVRVNGREYDSSMGDLTYRRPDARVGDVAFDVTIARKSLKTPQVRGFFNSDFKPAYVIIIRPRQLGLNNTYAIARKER